MLVSPLHLIALIAHRDKGSRANARAAGGLGPLELNGRALTLGCETGLARDIAGATFRMHRRDVLAARVAAWLR